ncbi:MAG: RHS repeat-associated core domain-containing protein [Sandaracinus sp.]
MLPLVACGVIQAGCQPPQGEAGVSTAALELPEDAFEGAIVDGEGHLGWSDIDVSVSDQGESTFELPIWVPPGRRGIQPELALRYAHRSGNGGVGVGWSVSGLSEISRCMRSVAIDQATRAVQFDEGDALCLDGQRLIEAPPDHGDFVPYDNATTRVDLVGSLAAPTGFRASLADGRVLTFGVTQDAVVRGRPISIEGDCTPESGCAVSAGVEVTLAWLLSRVEDRFGNYMTVTYVTHPRVLDEYGGHVAAEVLASEVRYTGHPTLGPGERSVRFEYEQTERPDPQLSFIGGLPLWQGHRLSAIYSSGPDGVARSYHLSYRLSTGTRRSLLDQVLECATGNFGSEAPCRDAIRLTYSETELVAGAGVGEETREGTFEEHTGVRVNWASSSGDLTAMSASAISDVDADGRQDLMVISPRGGVQSLRLVRRGPTAPWISESLLRAGDDIDRAVPVDVDWDGDFEVYVEGLSGSPFVRVKGTTSIVEGPGEQWELRSNWWRMGDLGQTPRLGLGDFDGNGVSDALYMSSEDDFGSLRLTRRGLVFPLTPELAGPPVTTSAVLMDTNGDARTELLEVTEVGEGAWEWRGRFSGGTSAINVDERNDFVPIDANGDGLTDIIELGRVAACRPREWVMTSDGVGIEQPPFQQPCGALRDPALRLNTGRGFGPRRYLLHVDAPSRQARLDALSREDLVWDQIGPTDFAVSDFNGDGLQDFIILAARPALFSVAPTPSAGRVAFLYLSNGRGFEEPRDIGDPGAPRWNQLPYDDGATMFVLHRAEPTAPLVGVGATDPLTDADRPHLSFGATVSWPHTTFLDWNGDSMPDMVYAGDMCSRDFSGGIVGCTGEMETPGTPDETPGELVAREIYRGRPDLLIGAVQGDAALGAFEYGPTPVRMRDAQTSDLQFCGPGPWSVRRHWDALQVRHDHEYSGSCYDPAGFGWLGFARHRITHEPVDLASGAAPYRFTDLFFDHRPILRGNGAQSRESRARLLHRRRLRARLDYRMLPLANAAWAVDATVYQLADAGGPLLLSVQSRIDQVSWSGAPWSPPALDERVNWDIAERARWPLPAAPSDSSLVTEATRTPYGRPLRVVETTPVTVDTTAYTYTPFDPTTWIFGPPTRLERTSESGGSRQQRVIEASPTPQGVIDSFVRAPDLVELERATTYIRDALGNIREVHRRARGELRVDLVDYDAEGIFPLRHTNTLGHESLEAIHPTYGVPTVVLDARGAEDRYVHDVWGRPRSVRGHGREVGFDYERTGSLTQRMVVVTTPSGGVTERHLIDWMGFVHAVDRTGFAGEWTRERIYYDQLGRVRRQEAPVAGGLATEWTELTYDRLDRVTELRSSGRPAARTRYEPRTASAPLRVISIDRRGHQRERQFDAALRPVAVLEGEPEAGVPGTSMTYTYGPFDLVTDAVDGVGTRWHNEFDSWGRTLLSDEPDSPPRRFEYNPWDELAVERTAAGAVRRSMTYDELSRPVRVEHPVDGIATFEWDTHGLGLLARTTRELDNVSRVFHYDAFGRPTTETTILGTDLPLEIAMGYDPAGRLESITYPQAAAGVPRRRVTYEYDERGFPTAIRDGEDELWRGLDYDVRGRLVSERFGNGVQTDYRFDEATSELRAIESASAEADPFIALQYGYDAESNVVMRHDTALRRVGREDFVNDLHGRLRFWIEGPSVREYRYDRVGNLRRYEGVELKYDSPVSPHRLTRRGGAPVRHDDLGRMTSAPGWAASYTDFDLPRVVTAGGVTTSYQYDAVGDRVRSTTPAQDTVFVHGLYERWRERIGGGLGPPRTRVTHVWDVVQGGRTIAQITQRGTGLEEIRFLHHDGLGSVVAVTSRTGEVAERYRFSPFGRRTRVNAVGLPIGAGVPEWRDGFTGHDHDDGTGLVNMRGRLYDPGLARFTSVDPLIADPGRRISWNPYVYVEQNPLTFADPTGFECDGCEPSLLDETLQLGGTVIGGILWGINELGGQGGAPTGTSVPPPPLPTHQTLMATVDRVARLYDSTASFIATTVTGGRGSSADYGLGVGMGLTPAGGMLVLQDLMTTASGRPSPMSERFWDGVAFGGVLGLVIDGISFGGGMMLMGGAAISTMMDEGPSLGVATVLNAPAFAMGLRFVTAGVVAAPIHATSLLAGLVERPVMMSSPSRDVSSRPASSSVSAARLGAQLRLEQRLAQGRIRLPSGHSAQLGARYPALFDMSGRRLYLGAPAGSTHASVLEYHGLEATDDLVGGWVTFTDDGQVVWRHGSGSFAAEGDIDDLIRGTGASVQ